MRKKRFCIDCDGEISHDPRVKRCRKCSYIALKGRKGKSWTKEQREKLRINRLAEKNPNWKGNKVQYRQLHAWLSERIPKPKVCPRCKIRKPFDLASMSQNYKRDIFDYEWICRHCHMIKDGRMSNLKQFSK